MSPLKLISLNCEGHVHLEQRVLPFLQQEAPDVVNLQEIFAVDIPYIQQATGMQVVQYAPMSNIAEISKHTKHALGAWGICQLSRWPVKKQAIEYYYRGNDDERILPLFFFDQNPNAMHRAVAVMTVEKDGIEYQTATTHLTWTPMGASTPEQLRDLDALLAILHPYGELVLSGDFNAPRGNPTFARLAQVYKDSIPAHYTTSIDETLHKAGKLELMVDGLFTSPIYEANQVRFVDQVSDHMAIVAEISRV